MVLAGGHSRRLGQDKAQLQLWGLEGPTLLEATIAHLAAVCDEVLVVVDSPRDWPALSTRVVLDRHPGGGALGGIYTGLLKARHPYVLTVAVDMPFLNPALLQYMAGLPQNYDVLVPRLPPRDAPRRVRNPLYVEPLHVIYGRPCLEPMRELLRQGKRRIILFFPQVRVRYLEQAELARFDLAGLSFRNINTPQDLEQVRRMLKS